ncbi:MAG TPA: coproporphyrinogen-III oxidase family protein, partial [Bacillota bacterium]|nr:coproporphyrinogen-III oxidase family protein [Bacillota bacterium]
QELGRIHSREQVFEAVAAAREAGFDNLSLDLMYGLPGQTLVQWQETLEEAVALGVEHISAYSLKLEEGTRFFTRWEAGELCPCDEDLEADMYEAAIAYLTGQGYEHYEISNFSRPGKNCRHNLTYWTLQPYLGLGPAAHSFYNTRRWSNTPNLQEYLEQVAGGNRPLAEDNIVSPADLMGEYMFLGLRLLRKGVSRHEFASMFGRELDSVFGPELERLLKLDLLQQKGNILLLTPKAIPVANEIFACFI